MRGLKAVFRTDATRDIGGGHVMRCLTLANALSAKGWECSFISIPETIKTIPALLSSGYQIVSFHEADIQADLLVVDHYGLDKEYETENRSWAKKILVIDDLADREHDCDVLLDQTLGRVKEDYIYLVPPHCRILTGSDYTILRPQFADLRDKALERRAVQAGYIETILVMLGSVDKHNETGRVLDALEYLPGPLKIDVLMGNNAPHLQSIKHQVDSNKHNVKIYVDVANVATIMARADLAIGAGGTASWERCCLGLPTLLIEIAENQRLITHTLVETGAALRIESFSHSQTQTIAEQVLFCQNNTSTFLEMSRKASEVCDGQGANRIASFLDGLY